MATDPFAQTVVEDDGWVTVSASTGGMAQDADAIRAALRDEAPTNEPAATERAQAADVSGAAPPPPPEPDASAATPEADADADDQGDAKGDTKAESDEAKDAKAETPAEPEAKADAEKPKPKRSLEARRDELKAEVDRLTWRKHQELRELDELAKRRTSAPERPAERPQAPGAVAPAPVGDKPTWKDYEARGLSWDDYTDAREAWTEQRRAAERAADRAELEREFRAREQARLDAEREAAHHKRLEAVRAKHADFDAVVTEALGEASGFTIQKQGFLEAVVKTHADGPELLYHLATHPDEARALAQLEPFATEGLYLAVTESASPVAVLSHFARHPAEFRSIVEMPRARAMLALGKLIARLDSAPPTASLSPAPVTRAAPPIRPVGGTRSSGGGDADIDEDKLSHDEWFALMDKRDAERMRARRRA